MEEVLAMKRREPEEFHSLVKMHLSFLLDLTTDGSDDCQGNEANGCESILNRKPSTPAKGIMNGANLTMEGVCQMFQIIQFLDQQHNIVTEGIFRKTGNLKKQQILKERLNRGIPMNLDDGEFSVHECASVIKSFLSELPEPLLTNAYFEAHCQAAELSPMKRIQCLQLLLVLIPDANYNLLHDLLLFLNKVTEVESRNKMSATNLGTIFAVHLLCPRQLSSNILQSKHNLFSQAVAFMISSADELFGAAPPQLAKDVFAHNARKVLTPKRVPCTPEKCEGTPVVNTVYSFVDRQKTQEIASSSDTDTALAELYAQVQSMPDSAMKKRLVRQFNDANGCGTPKSTPLKGSALAAKRVLHDNLKNWIVPKACAKVVSKEKKSGSYSLTAKSEDVGHNTFRKQTSDHGHRNLPATSTPTTATSTSLPEKRDFLIGLPGTPAENQNSIYFERNNGATFSMVDECDSLIETKQLSNVK